MNYVTHKFCNYKLYNHKLRNRAAQCSIDFIEKSEKHFYKNVLPPGQKLT
jgi:hypothetical protein